ncbi:diacylglycerol kinase family protein [Leptotrichia sp. oral taxon 221]|uniref:diacylglycerol/lipid kinase family protein n=1 Tax=Leptotrichia sp. oral taxon 221 TaxID=712362 RepID=UPI001B8B455A|nr:YegS/Rv2252/BmrU family lipid kinase [Leptotrichia sp. oral taxon 221]QUB97673.1 YegS/Rv2252/BmrU family lipid kinase [Leptotrichia sp. oral taxon 221]
MRKKLRKALLVYNPKSGNSNLILNNFDLITTKLLEKGIILTLYSISRNYDRLIEILKNEKYDIVILSGGDGTLSRCLTDMYNENIEFPEIAIFPTGTSNDLAKSLNLGEKIEDWINNILNKKSKFVDFGLINGNKIFLSSYAGGLFTKVSYATDKGLKKTFGKTAYYITGIDELKNIKKFDLKMLIDDNEEISEKAILYIILNGKNVGGFDELLQNANVDDGIMDILIVKNIENPLEISKILFDLFNGQLVNNENVRTLQAKKCVIEEVSEEIGVSIDGEEGKNEKVEIEFIRDKLKIFY